MPGYEPFLLCDFHVHTQWSDGKLTVREVVDLYGKTGKFDVIAITDHILMKKDLLARAGRIATLGRRAFAVREQDFANYLADIESEGQRALKEYGMLVVPGAEVTQNRIRAKKNSHIIERRRHPAGDSPSGRAQHRLPSAPHDHEANRDQHRPLFSDQPKDYPYVANSDFHKPKHLYSWKTLIRGEKSWPAVRQALRSNVDVAITLFRNGPACV